MSAKNRAVPATDFVTAAAQRCGMGETWRFVRVRKVNLEDEGRECVGSAGDEKL